MSGVSLYTMYERSKVPKTKVHMGIGGWFLLCCAGMTRCSMQVGERLFMGVMALGFAGAAVWRATM